MAKILVLYNQPADPAAFDRYYYETHIPIAAKIPGLKSCVLNAGPPALIAGTKAPYLIAELTFDSMADLQFGMASAEGQATAADVANFAGAGVTILAFETKNV
jgi:uncharacterized protein (TIGR02118 family)